MIEVIKRLQAQIAAKQAELDWVLRHRTTLEAIGVESMDVMSYSIDINWPTREQVLAIIQAFPGDWEKGLTPGDNTTLCYSREIDGLKVRLWSAPPPPSCRLIEEEVEIPAQPARREKRLRLECKPISGEEPAATGFSPIVLPEPSVETAANPEAATGEVGFPPDPVDKCRPGEL